MTIHRLKTIIPETIVARQTIQNMVVRIEATDSYHFLPFKLTSADIDARLVP